MKQKIFTLLMMLALVFVAGSAMALNETNVTAGGTYTYNLTTVKVNTVAGSSVSITGPTGSSVSSIIHGVTPISASGQELPDNTSQTLSFKITYGTASGDITVTVTDGGTGKCSNSIIRTITVKPAPTVDLTIANVTAGCQLTGTALDNVDAASNVSADNNTWTYTVTISMANIPSSYSGTATLTLGGAGTALSSIAMEALASSIAGVTFTPATGVLTWSDLADLSSGSIDIPILVKFTTTEGQGDLALTLTGSVVSVTETVGAKKYDETVTNNNVGSSTVYAMPTIGGF